VSRKNAKSLLGVHVPDSKTMVFICGKKQGRIFIGFGMSDSAQMTFELGLALKEQKIIFLGWVVLQNLHHFVFARNHKYVALFFVALD